MFGGGGGKQDDKFRPNKKAGFLKQIGMLQAQEEIEDMRTLDAVLKHKAHLRAEREKKR